MRILLGQISTAHGIRGEVVIKSHTDDPMDIGAYGPLSSEDGSKTYTIKPLRVAKKGVVARIEGVTDRNAAEALRGTELYIER
ncbi:MAG: 16S rRNA processing protein RimM, partial [Pseudomonadota bacterium]